MRYLCLYEKQGCDTMIALYLHKNHRLNNKLFYVRMDLSYFRSG